VKGRTGHAPVPSLGRDDGPLPTRGHPFTYPPRRLGPVDWTNGGVGRAPDPPPSSSSTELPLPRAPAPPRSHGPELLVDRAPRRPSSCSSPELLLRRSSRLDQRQVSAAGEALGVGLQSITWDRATFSGFLSGVSSQVCPKKALPTRSHFVSTSCRFQHFASRPLAASLQSAIATSPRGGAAFVPLTRS